MRYFIEGVAYLWDKFWKTKRSEILPGKNFDHLLGEAAFAAREGNGYIGASVIGMIPDTIYMKDILSYVAENFTGDDDKNFESGMAPYSMFPFPGKLLPTTTLYPYDHQQGTVVITITYHHFFKSWASPTVDFIIPHLNRPEGLKRCIDSIKNLNYLQNLINIYPAGGEGTVPEKVQRALGEVRAEYIVYAADDIEFTPDSLRWAVDCLQRGADLCAFNTGEVIPDRGNICEHFIIKKDFLKKLERGEIFSTDFHHVGCDNWLWAQASKYGTAIRCDDAIVHHYHFSTTGKYDETYAKGWSRTEEDRATLKRKLESL